MRRGEESLNNDKTVTALLLTHLDEAEYGPLEEFFREAGWALLKANSSLEAVRKLENHTVPVVIVAHEDWTRFAEPLQRALHRLPNAPKVVLTYRFSDALHLPDALDHGAYDLLTRPFEKSEVTQVVGFAWLQWKRERERAMMRVVPMRAAV